MATGVASWSTTAATNATADSAVNWAEGQAPSSVNDSARALMASVAKWRNDISGANTTGGTSTAYTLTTQQSFASLAAMNAQIITFIPHTTCGAAPTLAVDGLTEKNIRTATGSGGNLAAGALVASTPYAVVYFSSAGEFILLNGRSQEVELVDLDITGGTALTAPDTADLVAVYDDSAAANRKVTIGNFFKAVNTLTAETSVAADDVLSLYDTSASTADKCSITSLAASAAFKAMTVQYLTSGSGATYTTPSSPTPKTLRIKMVGGGGGGGAESTNNGTAGGTTSFNSVTAIGGSGGACGTGANNPGLGGAGGTGGTGGNFRIDGGDGGSSSSVDGTKKAPGGHGGNSVFGGGGRGTIVGLNGSNGKTNTGGGGGGGTSGATSAAGGGGAGEYVEYIITSPSATYTYTVGTGGAGGTAGGVAGKDGGSGVIIVEEYY